MSWLRRLLQPSTTPTEVKKDYSPSLRYAMEAMPTIKFDPSLVTKSVKADLRRNIELLGDIEKKHIPQIYEAALSSILAGRDHRSLVAALVRIEGMPQDRAWEITRNLHNKATEQINRERQSSLGITHAIWMYANAPCMKDPSHPTEAEIQQDAAHKAANRKRYDLSKGLLVNGKWTRPGVEEGCKCVSRAVLPWTKE